MNSDSFLLKFSRFCVSGTAMAMACAILVGIASQSISNNVVFFFVCILMHFFLSVINYLLQSCWVFRGQGSFLIYILYSIICAGVFGLVNTLVLYFFNSRNLTVVTFAYILSVGVVVPLSYFLNSRLFKNKIEAKS